MEAVLDCLWRAFITLLATVAVVSFICCAIFSAIFGRK